MIPFHAMKNFALILMFMLTASIAFATSSTSKENQPDLKTKITELESKIAELETKLKVQAEVDAEIISHLRKTNRELRKRLRGKSVQQSSTPTKDNPSKEASAQEKAKTETPNITPKTPEEQKTKQESDSFLGNIFSF